MRGIGVGGLADLAVLDDALMDVPVDRIGRIPSMLTLMDGRVIHATGPFALVRRN
jgi:predicted amidohydrolase YtcJ